MKRIVAVLLSLLLGVLPLLGYAEDFTATDTALPHLINRLSQLPERDNPQLTISLTQAADMTVSAALGQQADGSHAFALSFPGAELIVGEQLTTLTRWDVSYSVSTPELMQLLASFITAPQLSEQDLNALQTLFFSMLGRISPQAVSYSLGSNMLSLHINLDALLKDIDAAMPVLLRQQADALNPLVTKLSTLLLSQRLTCAELADLWPSLGLSSIRTGLEADVAVLKMGDDVSISASCKGHTLNVRISAASLYLSILPAGAEQAYVLDTNDLLPLVQLAASIPEVTVTEDEENDDILTVDVAVTRQAILNALARSSLTLENLLYKYDPWIRLLAGYGPATAAQYDDAAAVTPGYSQLLEVDDLLETVARMPETLFALHAVINDDDRTITATGELMNYDFTFDQKVLPRTTMTTWHASVKNRSAYAPLEILLNGSVDYRGSFTVTLNSNQPMFGAYAITLRFEQGTYGANRSLTTNKIILTTDTDAFHFLYNETYGMATELDVRLGDFSFTFDHPYRCRSMNATLINGAFQMNASLSESHLNISSETFGLDVLVTDAGLVSTGYLVDWYDMYAFTLQYDDANELFTLNLQVDGDSMFFAVQPDELKLRIDGEELVLRHVASGTWHLLFAGDHIATLLTERSPANQYRFRLLPGEGMTGTGVTLLVKFEAAPIVLPADAQPCTPEVFLQVIQDTFIPQPAAEEVVPVTETALP